MLALKTFWIIIILCSLPDAWELVVLCSAIEERDIALFPLLYFCPTLPEAQGAVIANYAHTLSPTPIILKKCICVKKKK